MLTARRSPCLSLHQSKAFVCLEQPGIPPGLLGISLLKHKTREGKGGRHAQIALPSLNLVFLPGAAAGQRASPPVSLRQPSLRCLSGGGEGLALPLLAQCLGLRKAAWSQGSGAPGSPRLFRNQVWGQPRAPSLSFGVPKQPAAEFVTWSERRASCRAVSARPGPWDWAAPRSALEGGRRDLGVVHS